MATSARFQWPPPRGFVSAYAQNLMAADIPETQVRVVDELGQTLPDESEGELVVRSKALFSGYVDGFGEVEAGLDPTGWFHTRDLALRRSDGNYEIRGRTDDRIVRGGRNIDPSEIEFALENHPLVDRAGVVAQRSKRSSEDALWAFVTLHSSSVDPRGLRAELRALCTSATSGSVTLRRIEVVDGLPLSQDGSVRRAALRAVAESGDHQSAIPRNPHEPRKSRG